jgi:signal transduction histidine kinase
VTDTGIGISQDDRGKLFQLFGKLEDTESSNSSGLGIGLNICKKILEIYGGTICLENDYSEGSRFSFCLKAEV